MGLGLVQMGLGLAQAPSPGPRPILTSLWCSNVSWPPGCAAPGCCRSSDDDAATGSHPLDSCQLHHAADKQAAVWRGPGRISALSQAQGSWGLPHLGLAQTQTSGPAPDPDSSGHAPGRSGLGSGPDSRFSFGVCAWAHLALGQFVTECSDSLCTPQKR